MESETCRNRESGRTVVEPNRLQAATVVSGRRDCGDSKSCSVKSPDDFQARCRLGELYFGKGKLEEALTEVKKAIEMAEGLRTEMDRSLAMYYSNLGTIYGTKGMMDDASPQFERALELNKYDVLALFNLGRLHQRQERNICRAKEYFERLIEITPGGSDRLV